jgi:thiosulfate dehydrogenase
MRQGSPLREGPSTGLGMGLVISICCAIGLITVVGTIAWGRAGRLPERGNESSAPVSATEEYGKRLLAQTTEALGPDVAAARMRYTRGRLSCASCHIGAGAEPGNLSLAAAIGKYPRVSPRSGGNETIQDRINGCMTRSMNGNALPENSPEMIAMVRYLRLLADQDAATGAGQKKAHEAPAFKTPDRRANLDAGERVFGKRCAACHGKEGAGLPASTNPAEGYVFPPLWGDNSFNDGAGLHRVLTAARFIKAKMPLGKADLSDDEAFDVAAYVNSKPRPEMTKLDQDFPDKTKKPIDTPYGPYADSFPPEQHRFGPFQPMEDYYRKLQKAARK